MQVPATIVADKVIADAILAGHVHGALVHLVRATGAGPRRRTLAAELAQSIDAFAPVETGPLHAVVGVEVAHDAGPAPRT